MWKQVMDDVIRSALDGFGAQLQAIGPNVLAAFVLLAAGLLIAGSVRFLVQFILHRTGFDRFGARVGLTLVLQRGAITALPSKVVAVLVAWLVLSAFVLLSVAALNLRAATELVTKLFAYLPQALIAVVVLSLGSLLGAFVRRSVLIAAVNAGLPSARLLAGGVHTALMILFTAMALEHLGVARQILVASFTVLFGGVVFALALSFGLAGRHLARELLERAARRPPQTGASPLQHL
jgi:hypothetical protein